MEIELKKRTPEEQRAYWARTLAEYQTGIVELELSLADKTRLLRQVAELKKVITDMADKLRNVLDEWGE